jgi:prepilin-type N-terminal cleavage/methylation domain-containing protein
MSLANIRNLQKEKGFTIVELLIVIVVIAILVAIVIVAYTGITQRANETAAKANAEAVLKVAEAYATDEGNGTYPSATTLDDWDGVTRIPSGLSIGGTQLAGTNDTHVNGTFIQYVPTSDGDGACIGYWDGSDAAYLLAGAAATPSNATNPATCA